MAKLVLTAIGDERTGLVAELASAVASHGGNWVEGQMARLGGKFAGVVLVDVPDAQVPALAEALQALGESGLTVSVTPADEAVVPPGTMVAVHLMGQDRPGIVSEVSAALAAHGASIDELLTYTQPAPMSDGLLFEADAAVLLPEGVRLADVQASLEAIAAELMVDLDIVDEGTSD